MEDSPFSGQTCVVPNPIGKDLIVYRSTLCWSCRHVVPNPKTKAGCTWSRHEQPVEGWVTKPSRIRKNAYCVLSCPKYEKGVK